MLSSYRNLKKKVLIARAVFFVKYLAKKEDRDFYNKHIKKGYEPIFGYWQGKFDIFFEISDEDALELINRL